jgi:hypothetical protein
MLQNLRSKVLLVSVALVFLAIGIIGLVLTHDILKGKAWHLGPFDWSFLLISILLIGIGIFNFLTTKKSEITFKLTFQHYLSLGLVFISLIALIVIWKVNKKYVIQYNHWSIGISIQNQVLDSTITNAVYHQILKAEDVTDVTAIFVADPMLFEKEGTYYLFFEVLNAYSQQGDIGLATSTNGLDWQYDRIVLDEAFHLSYPYVFRWKDNIYMVPETAEDQSVRLYKAIDFPYKWQLEKKLLDHVELVDPTLFEYNQHWWMFGGTLSNDELNLYYADQPNGTWNSHPQNPIIKGNKKNARPAGNIIRSHDTLVRLAQDAALYYGHQTWAFQIQKLTLTDYKEQLLFEKPILKGKDQWNQKGMHTFSSLKMENGKWLVVVDGF